ncbi:hypothetical protein P872_12195 [Rhodonellum psychrophilum GCM71 = DSM 17998]|uniref:Uncharacterized protein n=2 Tax=Rhodonellum TaxID=336827 RepID=U5BSI0_9BACT|nr:MULTISPECIES: hypothetical protein [Rhodonellum]ERM80828.1 hypothetical protein P872_12195 [Rhodonellum psychrophilum GCM71 = DSM 17998]MDO9553360.1 hypothetical protein [Rhodonellum sp.]SDZ23930.1 hypothetical protein SAMN05444412_10866 [Rhodonellum ikkaensis]
MKDVLEQYDEFLALAYTDALKKSIKTDDPVTNVFQNGSPYSFNYVVDYFETADEQGVDVENILAAGTLYYIKTLADDLGIMRVADAVLMRWTSGMLDIPQGNTANKLYSYYKMRDAYASAEERSMFYKIVLDSGDGEVLDEMAINRDFSPLWDSLMTESVKYIDKYESKDNNFNIISKAGIFQAIKELQYNLTTYSSGMVKAILPEMYTQFEKAVAIIDDDNVKAQLGWGYRRSMWNVIERICQEEFQYKPNVSAMRTAAVSGHKIFATIASFDEGLMSESAFQEFLKNIESFIISQSQLGDSPSTTENKKEKLKPKKAEMDEFGEDDWDF